MSKNPFFNAILAAGYITLVSSIMYFGSHYTKGPDTSIIAPMAVLSLFVLSAAVMAYVFGFEPFRLYFDGKREEAIRLFLQTVAVFAVFTFILLGVLFFIAR